MIADTLSHVWYGVARASEVKPGGHKAVVVNGEPVVLWRSREGALSAVRDICPHRGIPLSYGRVADGQIECPYHGWRFDGGGVCRSIPSLVEGQSLDCTKIKVKSYPVLERCGLVWLYFDHEKKSTEMTAALANPVGLPKVPAGFEKRAPQIYRNVVFPCHVDHAVIGLMDPAHGPFVHKSWFWRSEKTIVSKAKKFGPVDHGFRMIRHEPSKNSKAYKILGGEPTTEICFQLPSLRVEHIEVGSRNLISLTALAPIGAMETRVIQCLYWDMPWLGVVKPLISAFTSAFLGQDMDAVTKQQDGLKYDPTLMLIADADTQAKWYFRLKEEWNQSRGEGRAFANPVPESVLRWRS